MSFNFVSSAKTVQSVSSASGEHIRAIGTLVSSSHAPNSSRKAAMLMFALFYIFQRQLTLQFIYRWVIVFFTGVLTALLAALVHIVVEKISHAKFSLIDSCILLFYSV